MRCTRSFAAEALARAAGRYVLYVSLACPWACRTLATLYLKGLEHAIAVSVVHPVWARTRPEQDEHCGWQFHSEADAPVANPAGCAASATARDGVALTPPPQLRQLPLRRLRARPGAGRALRARPVRGGG